MDLYYYTLQFARDNTFNREKTSVFFSIMKKMHEVCIGNDTFVMIFSIFIDNLMLFASKNIDSKCGHPSTYYDHDKSALFKSSKTDLIK